MAKPGLSKSCNDKLQLQKNILSMTTEEIQELIDAYQQVADGELYSDNTRRAALRKVNSLREELGLDHVELKQSSTTPKETVTPATTTPFNKWFK
jgi:hypothetical protein